MQLDMLMTISRIAHNAQDVERTRLIKASHRNHNLLSKRGKRNRISNPIKIEQSKIKDITQKVATTSCIYEGFPSS